MRGMGGCRGQAMEIGYSKLERCWCGDESAGSPVLPPEFVHSALLCSPAPPLPILQAALYRMSVHPLGPFALPGERERVGTARGHPARCCCLFKSACFQTKILLEPSTKQNHTLASAWKAIQLPYGRGLASQCREMAS